MLTRRCYLLLKVVLYDKLFPRPPEDLQAQFLMLLNLSLHSHIRADNDFSYGRRLTCFLLMTDQYTRIARIVKTLRSGYQQKDRKPSQNDKSEHGMEKTVQNQGQSPKNAKVRVNTEESAVKPEPELKNYLDAIINHSDGPGKPNSSQLPIGTWVELAGVCTTLPKQSLPFIGLIAFSAMIDGDRFGLR
ncbi:hypothetical protein Tco_0893251 [Tanacetum coccineum]|uniref:Uncharacterized protein n=1 Tax=Tanacetum coccineum TaxID=301880 RepID=A0ABQ5C9T1_9ASTR